MRPEKEYDLNGTVYVQRTLVLGQVRQMAELLDGMIIPRGFDVSAMIDALGDKLLSAVAIALTEKGKSPQGKDVAALAAELEFAMTPEDLLQVIDDFFVLNPISSLLERIGNMAENATGSIKILTSGLRNSSLFSPAETSQDGMQSSGDILCETLNPG